MRVIHIVENLDGQATETWLLRVLRRSRERFPGYSWSFYCVLGQRGRLDAAAQELGARVIHSPYPLRETRRFMGALRRTLVQGGYDILHSHHDIVSSLYLLSSLRSGVRCRIVHVHNTSMSIPTPSRLKQTLARAPMRRICLALADRVVGASTDALRSMILDETPRSRRDVVCHCAIDTEHFENSRLSQMTTRAELGVSPEAKIILFAGRMTDYKNPAFVIEVLSELVAAGVDAIAIFAGIGPETSHVGGLAQRLDLSERVRLLGWRDDVAELMLAADVMIWPSVETPKEGLGLGVVEAQAAGLPVLVSRSVPREAAVVPGLVTVVPLAAGPTAWADVCRAKLRESRADRRAAFELVEKSSFGLEMGTNSLMALYGQCLDP